MEVRPISLTPEVGAFLVAHTPCTFEAKADPKLIRYGAFHDGRLVSVLGWYDGPDFRFLDEWAHEPTRYGKLGSAKIMKIARERRLVGHVALENEAARGWLKKNGGAERAVLADLPALGASRG